MAMFARICATLIALIWLSLAAGAQELSQADLTRWEGVAARADRAIANPDASEETLDTLRTQITAFREDFEAARSVNSVRIATLREQLAALNATAAGEGAEESEEFLQKRKDLTDQLSEALAPVQRAEAEFVRAEALVVEIDKQLRERQAAALLTVVPSPLNPANWQPAWNELVASMRALWFENPAHLATADGIPVPQSRIVSGVLALLGLILIFRGRRWSRLIVNRLQRFGARGFGIWRFIVSLFRIILPFAGLLLLALAAISTQQFGPKGNELLISLAFIGGIMLGVRWVSERVFARDDDEALLLLSAPKRARMRFYVVLITLMMALHALIILVLEANEAAMVSMAVFAFPFTVISSLALYRIGVMLRGYSDPEPVDETATELRASTLGRVVRGLGTGAVLVACVSPLLLAAGYFLATSALFGPYVMTLALLGLVMALQRFAADVYGAISGQGDRARDALVPVLIGLVLLVMLAPLLALVWGARLTDLTELWTGFERGIALGETRISPSDFLAFAVIFAIGYMLTRLLQSALRSSVLPKTRLDIGGQNAIVSGLGYVGIFLAAIAAISGAGIDLSSLALVASALTVGIGFGLQNIVSNFVSGIILLIERPISEGDWIEVGGQMGYVRNISVRSTRIETFDRTDVIVPNADLVSGTVTNYTRGNTVGRLIVPVGVAYGTDTKRVAAILSEIAQAQPMVLAQPAPNVLFVNFGADALEFEIRCFLRDVNWMMVVKSDINHAIAERFGTEGIEVPFAQRDLWLRNPEALRSQPADAPPADDPDPTPDKGTPA
ncbi:DUF3772 domain-containing protein [Sulfitobacter sp. JB4-11]|uniref:DUF3772 domain-containing protein n=1 Tax=Sulfitobacter rhodophyticola TaxID=3238304 RepID=UPI003513B1B8